MPLKEHKEYSFANHSASGNGKIKGIQGSRSINRYFLSLKTKNCGIYTCRVIVISKQPIALRKKGNSTKSIPIKVEKKKLENAKRFPGTDWHCGDKGGRNQEKLLELGTKQ